LPEGAWYDFYDTKKIFEGNRTISVIQPLEKAPVFIRSNSLYVTGTLVSGNSKLWSGEKPSKEFEIVAFPGTKNSQMDFVYVDSVEGNKKKRIALSTFEKAVEIAIPSLTADAALWIRLYGKPSGVSVNQNVIQADWNSDCDMVRITLKRGIQNKVIIKR
jgi:alpha-glucosidase (family GH31 glycosyl hydrolase)